mmetsp:Transcript_20193/g.30018  ORF Transcript_20193/g.30018 Transcript_20193/m.30018 type:complete len:210 (-) Transcript_20193:29-658(-)
MSAKTEAARLFRVYKTTIELLIDRNYLISQEEENTTLPVFMQKFADPQTGQVLREKLAMARRKKDDFADQIFVFFPEAENPGTPVINKYFKRMKEENVGRAILVVKKGLTSMAQNSLKLFAPDYLMEYFTESELLVNITHHTLVPPHELLTKDQKDALLKRHKLKETQLPRILVSDPVARYYGLQRGDVVKIRRPSETAGTYITYRYVL